MADAAGSANTILKILGGAQAGAEVSLAKGEYTLGSGADDDIQIIDVSLKPGHARIRVSPGKIEICAAAGSLKSANGIALEPNSDWQEVEPLDTITAGTTRFALGPPTAQWSTIAEAEAQQARPQGKATRGPVPAGVAAAGDWLPRGRQLVVPLTALILLIAFAVWQLAPSGIGARTGRSSEADEVESLRSAISQFPFAQAVNVRQDVDSVIFVSGYVEEPVQRRAIIGAIEKTGIPVRVRISVLQSIRGEIDALIKSERVNVTATVSDHGVLTLDGTILNEDAAARFVQLVRERILGIARVDSRIKTARTLLADVQRLAQVSQISTWVLLRNDGDLIEANGAIPLEKIDAWVGFLQAYAGRFAKDIALRSYVQLQGINVTGAGGQERPDRAIIIGGAGDATGDNVTTLDIERLRQGAYNSADVLVGANPGAVGPGSVAPAGAQGAGAAASAAGATGPAAGRARSQGAGTAAARSEGPPGGAPQGSPAAARNPTADQVTTQARELLEQWRDGTLAATPSNLAFKRALDGLAGGQAGRAADEAERRQLAERYLPLFAPRHAGSADSCWDESHLTPSAVPAVLFWLDLLSVTESVSLKTFGTEMQALLLEAALNPRRTARCATKLAGDGKSGSPLHSLYLTEVARNPDFVRFITRDLRPFQLDITGANLGPNVRFVQLRSGQKYLEGAAPSGSSRIALVGELGVAIQLKDGLSSIVFGPDLTWMSE
jgi:type III secretion system YscD/HrpQ family protein